MVKPFNQSPPNLPRMQPMGRPQVNQDLALSKKSSIRDDDKKTKDTRNTNQAQKRHRKSQTQNPNTKGRMRKSSEDTVKTGRHRQRKVSVLSLPPIDSGASSRTKKVSVASSIRRRTKKNSRQKKQAPAAKPPSEEEENDTVDSMQWMIDQLEGQLGSGLSLEEPTWIRVVGEDDSIQGFTPEPELFNEFPVFANGIAVVPESRRSNPSYRPRYCWCTRCQMMYRLYKEKDERLYMWGNYPCHQW